MVKHSRKLGNLEKKSKNSRKNDKFCEFQPKILEILQFYFLSTFWWSSSLSIAFSLFFSDSFLSFSLNTSQYHVQYPADSLTISWASSGQYIQNTWTEEDEETGKKISFIYFFFVVDRRVFLKMFPFLDIIKTKELSNQNNRQTMTTRIGTFGTIGHPE